MRMLETVQRILISILLFGAMLICACNELQKPRVEPFYGRIETPKKQEFRWSNGQSPKTLDPAFAFGSPETDLIRSLFEGLTVAENIKHASRIN